LVQGREYPIDWRRGRRTAPLAGGDDGALADRLVVALRHAEPVPLEGLAQRPPGGSQLLGGRVDATQLFGQGEGAFGLGPIGKEAAGLPAQEVTIVPAPLLRFVLGHERVL
jgi:hypothetical protein